jgi:hypothetical protein
MSFLAKITMVSNYVGYYGEHGKETPNEALSQKLPPSPQALASLSAS